MPRPRRRTPCRPSLLLPSAAFLAYALLVAPEARPDPADGLFAQSVPARKDSAKVLRHERAASCPQPSPAAESLDPPTTAALAEIKTFRVGDHFREDFTSRAEVRITWLGATFLRRFAAKIEDAAGAGVLQSHILHAPAPDSRIIDELGDEHETRLADLWCLLKIQAGGESGILLVNARPNVFYMRDVSGELGAVDIVWGGAGWEIGASAINGDRVWPAGIRVLSR